MLRDLTNQHSLENRAKRRHNGTDITESPSPLHPSRRSLGDDAISLLPLKRSNVAARSNNKNVGDYLSRVLDVQKSGRVYAADVVQFMEALQILPRSDSPPGASCGVMDRAVIQMLLEQLFAKVERAHPWEDSGSTLSSSTFSSFRHDSSVPLETCGLLFNDVLPSSSIGLAERLEFLELLSGNQSDREGIELSIEQLEEEVQTTEMSLGRYEVLIGQCQKALEARRLATHPLTTMVHGKLSQQEAAEHMLEERRCAEATAKVDVDASEELAKVRAQEVESWRARMGEWKQELRTVSQDLEAAKAEEEILMKRLESIRQHRASLERQIQSADEGVSACQESLDRALETWQDAVSIAASSSARHQSSVADVDDAKAAIEVLEHGIEVAREEFSLEKVEAQSILQRYHLLCAERRRLRESLVKGTLDLAALKNTLASIVEHSPRRPPLMPQSNDQLISTLIDELRVAMEAISGDVF